MLFEPDYDSVYSFSNWVDALDIFCISGFKMGLFGSLFYVGYVIGSLSFLRLGDVYGRKWVLVAALTLQTLILLAFYFVWKQWVFYVLMFLLGFGASVREGLSYVYAMEMLPKKNQITVGSTTFIVDCLPAIMMVVYLTYVSEHWQYFLLLPLFLTVTALLGIALLLPESPKFLYAKRDFDGARRVLAYMTKVNSVRGIS